ncbi:MAG: aldo/keto reductase, partial [Methylococcales bacterium]
MKYNQLGQTELRVSELCLGTMTFGEQNTEQQGYDQLDRALDYGINFIDTAEMYAIPPRAETFGQT